MNNSNIYSGYRYPAQVISHAVWFYHRFPLSVRERSFAEWARVSYVQNIDSVVSYNTLRDAAVRYFLTGMFNRKYLFSAGEKLFQNAKRKNITLMVAMIDIDNFKKINDLHDHYVGDKALQHIASMYIHTLREVDIISRMEAKSFALYA